jgi:hypothetical protein
VGAAGASRRLRGRQQRDGGRRPAAESRSAARGYLLRHRAALQSRLRGAARGQSRRRSLDPGRGHGDPAADRFRHPGCAARGRGRQPAGHAPVVVRSAGRGRQADRGHPPHRHRQDRLVHAARHVQGAVEPEGSAVDPAGIRAQGLRGARRAVAGRGAAGAGQSAGPARGAAGQPGLSAARDQQAGGRGHARQPRLHPALPGGHRAAVRRPAARHAGEHGRPALAGRLAGRAPVVRGPQPPRGRSPGLERCPGAIARAGRRACCGLGARGGDRRGGHGPAPAGERRQPGPGAMACRRAAGREPGARQPVPEQLARDGRD